ncbi:MULTISPECIES: hypothetical protein [Pectinatus]|uniref:hypothetical protein n=1 Tax=Pectinatus TaxID=864 RepID=UPI0018C65C2E|nr:MULTISPECIES: hypothetical protein [Pectinatus]
MLNQKQIKNLESAGFERWTKGQDDRLYINAFDVVANDEGFQAQIGRSGRFEREIEATKVYIDIETEEIVIDYGFKGAFDRKDFKALVDALVSEAEEVKIEDVIVDDATITFEESPEVVTGIATDKSGSKYLVRWAILPAWNDDEDEIIDAADWKHPISIELQD